VARRRMVIRKIDPFSVLKFGAVANLAVAAIGFVALSIVSRVVLGSGLVEQVCEIASDVGFLECGISQGRVTRLLVVLASCGRSSRRRCSSCSRSSTTSSRT
jgi:hypothetical protein